MKLRLNMFMHNLEFNKLPPNMSSIFTKITVGNMVTLPETMTAIFIVKTRTNIRTFTVNYSGPILCKSLHSDLRYAAYDFTNSNAN